MIEASTGPKSSQDETVQYGPCLKGQFHPTREGDPISVSVGVSLSGKGSLGAGDINAHF